MNKITGLRIRNRSGEKVDVFLDGKYTASLGAVDVAREGLKVGQELSSDRIEKLLASLRKTRCLDAAYRYLGYRQRTEAELRERLVRRGYGISDVEYAIARLREQGLLDDLAFAKTWTENRQSSSPRSRQATGRELRGKGVSPTIVKQVVDDINEEESALRAARGRAPRLSGLDYEHFYRKLGDFLKYRGFGYEVIGRTVKKVWLEVKESSPN